MISNLDGAVNSGHKQTDLIIMNLANVFDKVPHRGAGGGGAISQIRILWDWRVYPQVDQLAALWEHSTRSYRWTCLRSCPSAIRCATVIGPRSCPVPHLH